jgi:Putative serine esterase (DUF676)
MQFSLLLFVSNFFFSFCLVSSLSMGIQFSTDTESLDRDPLHTHLVILVHGYKGTEQDFTYLENTMRRQAHPEAKFIIHRSSCNYGKTFDGIRNGGERLALEVEEEVQKIEGLVKLSFVGHSLGGLYSRYAISLLDLKTRVTPTIFCTTTTPHLGCCNHTYVPIPRWAETTVGSLMADTGKDLFCMNSIIQEMGTKEQYLDPLRRFKTRIAIANAFATDILVPVSTAAFLSQQSTYPHTTLPKNERYVLALRTDFQENYDKEDVSQSLDSLGWVKLFLDVRDSIPLPSIPIPFMKAVDIPDKPIWISKELIPVMNQIGSRWHIPLGHPVAVANSRTNFYSWMTSRGQLFMDQVAQDLLTLMEIPLADDTSRSISQYPRETSEMEINSQSLEGLSNSIGMAEEESGNQIDNSCISEENGCNMNKKVLHSNLDLE